MHFDGEQPRTIQVGRHTVAGPDLTTAFVESNLGVVTAMVVSLMPRPEAIELAHACFKPDAFPELADVVVRLGHAGFPTVGLPRLRDFFPFPSDAPADSYALPKTANPQQLALLLPLMERREEIRAQRTPDAGGVGVR